MICFLPKFSFGQASLIQHLDATVAGSIISENGRVTEWKDQTSYNHSAVTKTGEIYNVQENKLSWLDFGIDRNVMEFFTGSESQIWFDQSSGLKGFCMILSLKTKSIHNDWNDIIGNSSVTSSGFGLRYSNSGAIKAYLGGTAINAAGSNIKDGDVVILAFNYDASSGKYQFWDSKNRMTVSGVIEKGNFSLANAVTLGSTTNNSRFFKGYIGELKIFSNALSEDNFQIESQYMFVKWTAAELDPPTPNPAGFKILPAVIGGTTINMTAITGFDNSGIVEYFFEEVTGNPGGDNSGWQSSPYYSDGGLDSNTKYSYRVRMRDVYNNAGEASQIFSAVTNEAQSWQNDLDYGAYYGYQAWHQGPEDNWNHWVNNGIPDAAHMGGDNWPDFSEYPILYETQMKYPNGSPVKVYSCNDYETVDVHIRWMKEYGIKGCFVQRQQNLIGSANYQMNMDLKAQYIRRACEKYGVKFCLMPCNNNKSTDPNPQEYIDNIIDDWKHCIDDLKITESPMYMHQDGKPVIGFWGLGFDNRSMTPDQASQILDSFQKPIDSKYKVYVMGGVHINWRINPKTGWSPVFNRLDMISPWRTLFGNPDSQTEIERMTGDMAYCDEKGIDYNPVVSPGASTAYQHGAPDDRNWKPRDGGKFLWKQVYQVCKAGGKFIYVAMFDEIDEGTAIYKMAKTQTEYPVLTPSLVPLNEDGYNLPGDWYLQIGTEIQKMLEGKIPLTEILPINPNITSLKKTEKYGSLIVYPVPAKDILYIYNTSDSGKFKILNLNGNVVFSGMVTEKKINLKALKSGLYLLQLDEKVIRFTKQ